MTTASLPHESPGQPAAIRVACHAAALVLSSIGCVEYNPSGIGERDPATDASSGLHDTGGNDTVLPEETCDGRDNDWDGEVDEGFPDVDRDGHADCVDLECAVAWHAGVPAADDDDCSTVVAPPAEPWNVELFWEFTDAPSGCRVGSVADFDGDGVAEIACSSDVLYVLDGASGAVEWTSSALVEVFSGGASPVTAADLDRDGFVDLVGIGPDGGVVAIDGTGAVKWQGDADIGPTEMVMFSRPSLEVADVDADGTPEIIGHHGIVSGVDGSIVAWLDTAGDVPTECPREIAVGDIERDGTLDLVNQWQRYDTSGNLVFEYPPADGFRAMTTPMFAQADGDDDAEVFWLSEHSFDLFDEDGTGLVRVETPDDIYTINLPCGADLDGDGFSDVAFSDHDALRAWNLDGSELWSTPIQDPSTGTGCSVFDFDLDGRKEVLLGDEENFLIFDGSDGTVLYRDAERRSNTVFEIPIVVDLDNDGSVEVVMACGGGAGFGAPLRVYRNVNRDWPPGAAIWPSETWSGTSHNPDGTVPRTAKPPWLETGVWRGQVEVWVEETDLLPEVVDWCVSSCELDESEVRLSVRLVNQGDWEVQGVAPIAVYGLDDGGGRAILATVSLADLTEDGDTGTPSDPWLDDGHASATAEVALTLEQALRGVVLVAGDDGTGNRVVRDCDPSNDEAAWVLEGCPGGGDKAD